MCDKFSGNKLQRRWTSLKISKIENFGIFWQKYSISFKIKNKNWFQVILKNSPCLEHQFDSLECYKSDYHRVTSAEFSGQKFESLISSKNDLEQKN